jgi:hypothetical protein
VRRERWEGRYHRGMIRAGPDYGPPFLFPCRLSPAPADSVPANLVNVKGKPSVVAEGLGGSLQQPPAGWLAGWRTVFPDEVHPGPNFQNYSLKPFNRG